MFPNRILSLLAALCCLGGLAIPAAAAETDCDSVYCFSPADFSEDQALAGICVTGLPDWGSVTLGTRIIQSGDILTAQQLGSLTFHPVLTEDDQEAVMTYLPIFSDHVAPASAMTLSIRGKENQAPVAEDSAMETYKNLPNEAMLKVKDPEGQALTYTITRQPRRGDVTIREDGSFIYAPKKNKVGVDSFTYTATDPAGNVSREATVTITIMKPTTQQQYADTANTACRFAAEWMKNTGIFISESIGGNSCFQPEKTVSRGEFLTMLVGALDIPLEDQVQYTGFTDECADWLKPYLAAAMRSGLTTGWPEGDTFQAESPITGAEAAVMVQNALNLSAEVDADAQIPDSVPAWACNALTALEAKGITLDPQVSLTRGDAAVAIYQIAQLAPSCTVTGTMQ